MSIKSFLSGYYKCYKYRRFVSKAGFDVRTTHETIDHILQHRSSVSRYGDGEFEVMFGNTMYFQKADPRLVEKLKMVVNATDEGHIVCLPMPLKDVSMMIPSSQMHWMSFVRYNGDKVLDLVRNKVYYDTQFTRFYMDLADKSQSDAIIHKIRKIWHDRDVYLIEGQTSRIGVGNDFLSNARSVNRILGPARNAFAKYDDLLAAAEQHIPKDPNVLILVALGMTATVLSYDLFKMGYQTIDVGHADIEYCWWQMKVTEKCPVPGKATYEAGAYEGISEAQDAAYNNEIICKIE